MSKKLIFLFYTSFFCTLFLFIYLGKTALYDVGLLTNNAKLQTIFPHSFERKRAQTTPPIYVFWSDVVKDYQSYCISQLWRFCSFLPHQQFQVDLQWIQTIQYVGKNINRYEVEYFIPLLEAMTNLSPQWSYLYYFGQLLWPINKLENNVPMDKKLASRNSSIDFGQKGIKYICNNKSISKVQLAYESIDNIEKLSKIWEYLPESVSSISPCASYKVPHQLAFNYYYYLQEPGSAWLYYIISSLDPESPRITKNLPSIIRSQENKHLTKSTLLRWQSSSSEDIKNSASLSNAIYQFQLYILSYATSQAQSSWQCTDKLTYTCLLKNWFLTKTYQTINNRCRTQNYDITPVSPTTCKIFGVAKKLGAVSWSWKLRAPQSWSSISFIRKDDEWQIQ